MSYKKLAILGLVAAAMVVWAAVQSNIAYRPVGGSAAGGSLLQGFDPATVGSIVVKVQGNTVTLSRQGGIFVVGEKDRYPAKTSQINNLITSCLDIQTAELITTDTANFAELGVADEAPVKSVSFLKPDKSLIAGILIGKPGKDTQGTYVRLVSSDRVYLSTNEPPLFPAAIEYLERNLTEVAREDIVRVSAEGPDGASVITNEPHRGAALANVPAGKKERISRIDAVLTVLTNLMFDDVMKDSGKLRFDRTYTCQLRDSTVYTLQLATKGNKTFAKCSAEFMDKSAVVKRPGVESPAELKAKEAILLGRDKVEEFNRKTKEWVYEIPESKAANLKVRFADLIEDERAAAGDADKVRSLFTTPPRN